MDRILELLIDLYLYDIGVMSNPWMYIPFLIPIIVYLVFFAIKWAVLALPVWLPIVIIVNILRGDDPHSNDPLNDPPNERPPNNRLSNEWPPTKTKCPTPPPKPPL